MMRRYFVQAIDERTGLPCLAAMIEAGSPRDVLWQAHRKAALAVEHLEVRVTSFAEQGTDATGAALQALKGAA